MSDFTFRPNSIAVSAEVHWCFRQVAAHDRAVAIEMESHLHGVDAICTRILREHLSKCYPQLLELWERRQGIDKQAQEAIQNPL